MMDVLVCADEVTNPKPHPEPVEKALALLGAEPATTVYVGDSIHDMVSGRAAGCARRRRCGVRSAASTSRTRRRTTGWRLPESCWGCWKRGRLRVAVLRTISFSLRPAATRPGSRGSAGSAAPR